MKSTSAKPPANKGREPALFDANAYLGRWPFNLVPELKASRLVEVQSACGIQGAAVSPLDAVFQPEPGCANRRLFAQVSREKTLLPLPVVNPALANWREQLKECLDSSDTAAVRLFPTYHNYRLTARFMGDFMEALSAAKLRLVLTARLEDDRHRYFALKIKALPLTSIVDFLKVHGGGQVLCTGLGLGEILKLAELNPEVRADISYAEHLELPAKLRGRIEARRLLFGSLYPLVSVQAQTGKLLGSDFNQEEKLLIGGANAREFFKRQARS